MTVQNGTMRIYYHDPDPPGGNIPGIFLPFLRYTTTPSRHTHTHTHTYTVLAGSTPIPCRIDRNRRNGTVRYGLRTSLGDARLVTGGTPVPVWLLSWACGYSENKRDDHDTQTVRSKPCETRFRSGGELVLSPRGGCGRGISTHLWRRF